MRRYFPHSDADEELVHRVPSESELDQAGSNENEPYRGLDRFVYARGPTLVPFI